VRILFTGASSFTGFWFVRELAAAGHDVTATFRTRPDEYGPGVRALRVALATKICRAVHGVTFGDERFLAVAREGVWDLLAHHAADVTNYKSMDFDVPSALQRNTHNLSAVLDALRAGGCRKVLLTGSVFEGGEGAGSQGLPHFSPYGLSKALTAETFRYHCQRAGLTLGKFVIPNPFGPYEEPRYTAYLMKAWLSGATPACASPSYVRDNIHVSLLAKVYVRFAQDLPSSGALMRVSPSGYAESQGAFTRRLAEEMRGRLKLPCLFELKTQTEFPEPQVRINIDVPDGRALGWDEAEAWDDMARYYRRAMGRA
jgi:nucleoside-diphosphate-sugar epimerase